MKKRAITGTITMMDEENGSMPQVYYAKVQVKILCWWVVRERIWRYMYWKYMKTYKMFQYPRGVNKGGILNVDICPTISCSSWENNCLLIE